MKAPTVISPKLQAIAICSLLTLAACAAPTGNTAKWTPTDAEVEQYNAQVPPEEQIVCRKETPVGTYVPRRVCRLQVDVDATEALHRSELRRVLQ